MDKELEYDMRKLTGRRVMITGGSSGIGEALARLCISEGAAVAVLARRGSLLDALAAETGCVAIVADVADEESIRRGVAAAAAALGGIDVVVNNAGIGLYDSFVDGTPAHWRQMIDVNFLGTLFTTHSALQHLRRSKGADVINLASATIHKPATSVNGVYAASKVAVRTFSDSLREELRDEGIRVTTVSPGAVATNIALGIPNEKLRASMAKHLVDAGLQPVDVARAIVNIMAEPRHVSLKEVVVVPHGH